MKWRRYWNYRWMWNIAKIYEEPSSQDIKRYTKLLKEYSDRKNNIENLKQLLLYLSNDSVFMMNILREQLEFVTDDEREVYKQLFFGKKTDDNLIKNITLVIVNKHRNPRIAIGYLYLWKIIDLKMYDLFICIVKLIKNIAVESVPFFFFEFLLGTFEFQFNDIRTTTHEQEKIIDIFSRKFDNKFDVKLYAQVLESIESGSYGDISLARALNQQVPDYMTGKVGEMLKDILHAEV